MARKRHFISKDEFEEQYVEQRKDFVAEFHRLPFSEALAYYRDLLDRSSPYNSNVFEQRYALYELKHINESIGLTTRKYSVSSLSKEERLIIRMDYYGTIDRIPSSERSKKLSRLYLRGLNKPLDRPIASIHYDLKKSPSWQLYARFEKFRRIENKLKEYMSRTCFNPNLLSIMTPRDFSDLIVNAFAKTPTEAKVTFEYPMTTRKRFVKKLAKRSYKQIYQILASKYDERWVSSIVNMMRRYGSTSQAKFVITEIYWTPRILNDLETQGMDISNFKIGTRIPKRILDSAFDMGIEKYFLARDNNGCPLRKESFPSFEVHHKNPVSLGGELTDIASVNYENNLCLVLSELHSQILHGKDRLMKNRFYSDRIVFMDQNTAFMAGLSPKDQISVNFNEDIQMLAHAEEDSKHYCSYDVCMKKLSDNGAACAKMHKKLKSMKTGKKPEEGIPQHDCTPKHPKEPPKMGIISKLIIGSERRGRR